MPPDRRTMLATLSALAATGLLGRHAAAAEANRLVVTTLGGVWEKFWRESIVPGFTAATGAEVVVDVGNGRSFSAALRTAGDAPPYSMLMTNEVFAVSLRQEGYFEQLDLTLLPSYADLYPIARGTDGWGAIGAISPIGLGYRTDLVKTPPRRWRDLWDNPEFSGRIGLYNFANSAGKMELMLASKLYGRDLHDVDAGFAALSRLGRVIQVDFNLSTVLAAGDIVVAPFDFGEIARLRRQGLPVDCVVPEEGMLMFDQTLSVCRHGPAKALAYKYIEFLLSAPTQTLLARNFYTSPVNSRVVVPPDLAADVPVSGAAMGKILSWDWNFVNTHAVEFAERWNKSLS